MKLINFQKRITVVKVNNLSIINRKLWVWKMQYLKKNKEHEI